MRFDVPDGKKTQSVALALGMRYHRYLILPYPAGTGWDGMDYIWDLQRYSCRFWFN